MEPKDLYYELHKSVFGRVNVMTRQSVNGQMIVLYDDHRWLLNIGNRHSCNLSEMNGEYTSEDGIVHNVFELSEDLGYELGCRGQLGDTFDLDFFTMSFNDEATHGWTPKILNKHFPDHSMEDRMLRDLIRDAKVITICREPDYCGSIGDSNRILEMLDRYYFEGCIGTDSSL